MVNTVDMVYTFNIVLAVDMVYTVDIGEEGAEAFHSLCSTLYLIVLYWAVLSCSKLNWAVLGYTTLRC